MDCHALSRDDPPKELCGGDCPETSLGLLIDGYGRVFSTKAECEQFGHEQVREMVDAAAKRGEEFPTSPYFRCSKTQLKEK